jgi:hypothetical protein
MITAVLLMGMLIVYAVIGSAIITFKYMPYVSGGIGVGILYTMVKKMSWIPGHPVLSFVSILLIVEIVLMILLSNESTCKATAMLTCSVVILLITMIAGSSLKITSWQYALVCTLIYSVLSFMSIFNQLNEHEYIGEQFSFIGSVLSSVISAIGVFVLVFGAVGVFWDPYFESIGFAKDGIFDKVELAVVFGISAGYFIISVIKARRQMILEQI